MNLRGGWALVRSSWLSWMQYRSFFFILAFGWMIPPLVALFAWLAAAANQPVNDFSPMAFTVYYLALVVVNQFTYAQANWTLGDNIRAGSLSHWLLRPMAAIFHVLASEAAGKTVMLFFVIPAVPVLGVFFCLGAGVCPDLSFSRQEILVFLPALALAWALRFLWGCWLALLAFWSDRSDALLALQDSLVFVFSGMLAPVELLPGILQTAARWLPFRYMVGFPVEALTRHLTAEELIFGFTVQALWLAATAVLTWLLWQCGLRHYSAVGG